MEIVSVASLWVLLATSFISIQARHILPLWVHPIPMANKPPDFVPYSLDVFLLSKLFIKHTVYSFDIR